MLWCFLLLLQIHDLLLCPTNLCQKVMVGNPLDRRFSADWVSKAQMILPLYKLTWGQEERHVGGELHGAGWLRRPPAASYIPSAAHPPPPAGPPAHRDTLGPPTYRDTLGPPTYRDTLSPPTYRDTLGPPNYKDTLLIRIL
jgi:hypothetical protein